MHLAWYVQVRKLTYTIRPFTMVPPHLLHPPHEMVSPHLYHHRNFEMVSPRSVEYVHDKFICMWSRKCFMYADGMHTDAHTNAFVMPKFNDRPLPVSPEYVPPPMVSRTISVLLGTVHVLLKYVLKYIIRYNTTCLSSRDLCGAHYGHQYETCNVDG
jgi:hypothetical protein